MRKPKDVSKREWDDLNKFCKNLDIKIVSVGKDYRGFVAVLVDAFEKETSWYMPCKEDDELKQNLGIDEHLRADRLQSVFEETADRLWRNRSTFLGV